ncbi:hypothetical protein PROFUN_10635 [Planoprotostelium fungivorum]|uniref:Uncharacterized protein n=1 Tax=Planoprotostelium fungivorum TaxID=1890364 RepID=A0A2P6ND84_9EUKA|nr:hypothetical protein PROFUN_10635 [Planoprotostelium fungivorum]
MTLSVYSTHSEVDNRQMDDWILFGLKLPWGLRALSTISSRTCEHGPPIESREPESSAHSVSPIEISSTFSSAVSFGSHYRGKRWKDRLSSLVSIRSIYIAMTLGLVISVTAIIAPLSVVSQRRLILDGLNDRANTNILLTNVAVVSLLSQSSDLLKTMSTAYTSFRFQPLHLNGSYPVPLPDNYMFWMDIAQSAVLQVGSLLRRKTGLHLLGYTFLFNRVVMVSDTKQIKGQHFDIFIGNDASCNQSFQVSDILQTPGRRGDVVNSYSVSYAVCDDAGKVLTGMYSSFTTTSLARLEGINKLASIFKSFDTASIRLLRLIDDCPPDRPVDCGVETLTKG